MFVNVKMRVSLRKHHTNSTTVGATCKMLKNEKTKMKRNNNNGIENETNTKRELTLFWRNEKFTAKTLRIEENCALAEKAKWDFVAIFDVWKCHRESIESSVRFDTIFSY